MQTPHGLVEMTNAEYHAAPGVSSSKIKDLVDKSLLHFWYQHVREGREPRVETEALRFGSAVHGAVLEPDLFHAGYVAAPADAPNRPAQRSINAKRPSPQTMAAIDFWEEFDLKHKGKISLSADEHQRCLAIRDRVYANPVTAGLLSAGRAEQSFFAQQAVATVDGDTGEVVEDLVLTKCRPDYMHDSGYAIVDLKTTRNAEPKAFGKDIGKLLYDISAPFYLDVIKALYGEAPKHFVWLAVESDPPHAMSLHFATPDQIARARECGRLQLARLAEAYRKDVWPDWSGEVLPADIPSWVRR